MRKATTKQNTKPGTKQRILDAALVLFNEFGTPTISTNHIALELDISPGNLYYHHKNKIVLIEQLFEQYHQALKPLLEQNLTESLTIEDVWFLLHISFELSLQYRFIYQDTDYIILKCPALAEKFRHILQNLNNSLLRLLKQLSQDGVLTLNSESMLEDLSLNMSLVCTQWISFKRYFMASSGAQLTGDDLSQGVYQVLSLLLPYLDAAHQAHLLSLREEYK